jgi:hypothetical protein
MPIPTKIPSISRKKSIISIVDPITYSQSSATIGEEQIQIQGLTNPSSIGQIFFRLNSKLIIAARRLNINTSSNLSISLMKSEITRLMPLVQTQRQRNYLDEASYALFDAEQIKVSLIKATENLAVKDVTAARKAILDQVSNASIRDELNEIINSISRNTRFTG